MKRGREGANTDERYSWFGIDSSLREGRSYGSQVETSSSNHKRHRADMFVLDTVTMSKLLRTRRNGAQLTGAVESS